MRLDTFRGPVTPATAVRSEISVTPLVDVCLVLLIIFMVVAPLLAPGGELTLPTTERPLALHDRERIELEMLANGRLRLGGREVAATELVPSLRAARRLAPSAGVRILADERLPYREVRAAMRSARIAGFGGVELAAEARAGGRRTERDRRGAPP